MRRLLVAAALFLTTAAGAAIPSSEREALVALYQATGGSQWTNRTGWLGAAGSECDWYGVQCNEQRTNVDVLYLFTNNLTGTLPAGIAGLTKLRSLQLYDNQLSGPFPAAIGQLAEIQSIFLSRNQLDGPLPASLGSLVKLEDLEVNGNSIDGPLPDTLSNLAALRYLDLSYNEITGPIPDLSRTRLEYLSLAVNQFSGAVPQLPATIQYADFAVNGLTGPIPAHLATRSELLYLRLSNNLLSGGIPPALAQLKKLETLDLYNIPLGGPLPREIGDLTALKFLNVSQAGITGTIPPELYRLTNLEELYLAQNQLEGTISPEIGKLQNLVRLALNGNTLTGTIPVDLTTLTRLEDLDLLVNRLSGSIPPEIGRLQNLRYIDLAANLLDGPVPAQLGDLTRLTFLSLYENDLEGSIPSELGKLTELTTLYLGGNRLTGSIPDSLRSLAKLRALSVNGNRLSGPVPSWIGDLRALEELNLSENRLGGPLPAGFSALEKLQLLSLYDNEISGPLPDFARMTGMRNLFLSRNQFSGRIPESIGAMTELIDFSADFNALSGPLPREIGNLTKLTFLSLTENSLDGPIPAEIGALRSAYNISLDGNRFEGTIPRQIGDLSENLIYLGLALNALRGPIPAEITRLTRLQDGASDFSYNALHTTSTAVREFVNRKQYDGDFELTQTVPPTDVQVSATTDRSATLTWTPIRYSWDPGGYRVTVSKSSGGSPIAVPVTANKDATSITVRNLDPSTRYFFTVSTVTHPHPYQKNLIVSDDGASLQATTGERVIAPADVVVSEFPEGLVQIDGVEAVPDSFTLTNFGDVSTTVELERGGDFFTIDQTQLTLAGGASRTVTLRSTPQVPGTYWGHVVARGQGVAEDTIAYVVLLSVKRPAGTVVARPVEATIELSGAPGSDSVGVAQFRNTGTADLTGIVVSDQPWVVPDPQPITISPGQTGAVGFRVVRSKRPSGADGALSASLSLVYVDGGAGSVVEIADGTAGVSVSKVTIIDTTKPPVSTGSIPPLGPGEIPLFVPGIAALGSLRTDLSLINAFSGPSIGDLKLYFSTGAATSVASLQPLKTSESVNFVNLAGNIYGVANGTGTLQIRSRSWSSIVTDAKVTAVTPAGTYSGAIPVFRGDRSIRTAEVIHLAGVAAGGDLFVQETGGSPATVGISFLDAAGNAVGSTMTETVGSYALRELRGVIPANAATAVITNGGGGTVTAYARLTDAATGDSWSVVDWGRFYRYPTDEAVRVPFADGPAAGGGGKRRSVRTTSVGPEPGATRAATDLVLFNPTTVEVRATVQLVAADGSATDRSVAVAPRATITLRDIGATASSSTAHAVVTPLRGHLVVTARSHAGSRGTAVPVLAASQGLRIGQSQVFSGVPDSAAFHTAYGLVETGGSPVTVRARILIGESFSLVTATTTRTFQLAPRQQVFLPELLRSFAGALRDELGDLHDLTLEFEVTSGDGAVVPFLITTDTGTGDSSMTMQ